MVLFHKPKLNDQKHLENLDLLEAQRDEALVKIEAYKQRMARSFNKGIKIIAYQPRELVVKRVFPNTKELGAEKLASNWEGPYNVVKMSRLSTYWLETMEGRPILHLWNVEHHRKYF